MSSETAIWRSRSCRTWRYTSAARVEPAFRQRADQISRRHTDAISESVGGLAGLGLVTDASAQVRVHGGSATFKLYILNRTKAFFGFYPITEHACVCDLRGIPAAQVARKLREQLAAVGVVLPDDGQPSDDPLDVFRGTRQISRETSAAGQGLLISLEVQAVASARPTPRAAELIKEAHQTGRTVAIVSNNSGAAIRAYLQRHDLTADVALIVGRDSPDPDLMKSSPYLVRAAVGILDTEGQYCVFIGDSAVTSSPGSWPVSW